MQNAATYLGKVAVGRVPREADSEKMFECRMWSEEGPGCLGWEEKGEAGMGRG